MRRIAHVISTPKGVGGAERVVAALAGAAAGRGWEALILNPFNADASSSMPTSGSVEVKGHPCSRIDRLPAARRWLVGELRRFSPHIVHAHLFHALVLTASAPRTDSRLLLTHHHGDVMSFQKRRVEALLDRLAGGRFDHVVAVSQAMAELLVDDYHYPPAKVSYIRNGWSGTPTVARKDERPQILCIANFRSEKAHHLLIEAFQIVIDEIPQARLVLVGDGPLKSEVEKQAALLSRPDAVEFVGPVDDVWPYLSRASVFALASLREPLGIVIMEAMAAGLPVVAPRVGGIPELVEPGVTGELVAPGDSISLGQQIVRLLKSRDLRSAMGEAAQRAAETFRMERMVDQYYELYERLAPDGATP